MYDLKIINGCLVDPAKKSRVNASVYVKDGRIARIDAGDFLAKETVDAAGAIVCPGFIDPHGHVDGITAYRDVERCAALSLAQGVTTIVSGNCGASVTDMNDFFAFMDAGFVVNQAELIGHSALRRMVGLDDIFAPATDGQIAQMERLCRQAMEQGALGVSFGLGYVPGTSLKEVDSAAAIAKAYGGLVAVDTYMDDNYDLSGLQFVIDLCRRLGVRCQVSHFVYQYGQGVIEEALQMMDAARGEGLDIWADSGLYVDWASGIGSECFRESFVYADGFDMSTLLVATGPFTGQRLGDELYWEMRTQHPRDSVICKTGWESSVYPPFTRDYMMPSSDTAPYNVGEGHPQIAGSFAGFFRRVREDRFLGLEEAVYRASLLPAQVFGLGAKGRLAVGYDADITIFDEAAIADMAAYPDEGRPDAPATGVKCVLIQGKLALKDGKILNDGLGQALRG